MTLFSSNNLEMPELSWKKAHIVILGGGISGLSALHSLTQTLTADNYSFTLIEADDKVGGKIQSRADGEAEFQTDVYHDFGPHSFRTKGRGLTTLRTIVELGLAKYLISPAVSASRRMIYEKGCLHELTTWSVVRMIEWKAVARKGIQRVFPVLSDPSSNNASFFFFLCNNFGKRFADVVGKSMIRGIFAGNPHAISVKDGFPEALKTLASYFSKVKEDVKRIPTSLFMNFRERCTKLLRFQHEAGTIGYEDEDLPLKLSRANAIYTFEKGMMQLPMGIYHATCKDPRVSFMLQSEALALHRICHEGQEDIHGTEFALTIATAEGNQTVLADYVICALPANRLLKVLLSSKEKEIILETGTAKVAGIGTVAFRQLLSTMQCKSVTVANVLSPRSKLKLPRGFGYLTCDPRDPILGVIFDSSAFPARYSHNISVCTVMLKGSACTNEKESMQLCARRAVQRAVPTFAHSTDDADLVAHSYEWTEAIPQYTPGYLSRVTRIREILLRECPSFVVCGSSFDGISVNDALHSGIHEGARPIVRLCTRDA